MSSVSSSVISFLKTRRSVLARNIATPAPSAEEINDLLTIGARVPDHGKLAPWRFIVFQGEANAKFDEKLSVIFQKNNPQASEDEVRVASDCLARAPLVIGVVASPKPHPKIPEWEQYLSAAAVCQNILVGAQSLGYGAQWLTQWICYDMDVAGLLGLQETEKMAGFIYIGTASEPPKERARPETETLTSYWSGA
ncbi:MAG: nitroreductase family protein [Parvibaculales bacterium]